MKKVLTGLFLIPVGLLSILMVAYVAVKSESFFAIDNVKITGTKQLTDQDVMTRATPLLRENMFRVDVQKISDALTGHPYVREVRVKRVFPFAIVIDVREKKPSALWVNGEGDVQVVDEEGVPYRKMVRGDEQGLFVINALRQEEVKRAFSEVSKWTKEGTVKKEYVSEVACHDGGFTLFGEGDGVEIILGKEDYQQRLKRALAILNDAKKRGLLIRCIDARFEKGAIIHERKG